MSQDLKEPEAQTFVEVALTLGGKSAEESSKTGKLDRADDQVEARSIARSGTESCPSTCFVRRSPPCPTDVVA
jgi:hypothetical protein